MLKDYMKFREFDFVKYDEILKRCSVVQGSGTKESKTYEANKNN